MLQFIDITMKKVASFTDPKTGKLVEVFPKKGESPDKAIARVTARHGLSSKSSNNTSKKK